MNNIICIVQARMSSTRLPGKVLLDLSGKPVVAQVFNQLSYSKLLNNIVLATTIDPSDDLLEEWAINNSIKYFRGSLENVLERFYETAKMYNADAIVRITADCPLIDPELIDICIEKFSVGNYDYYSNTNPPTFPDGLDCEIFKFSALKDAYRNAQMKSEIEHVTPYMRNHPEKYKIGNYISEINYENYRWTLDNKEDYVIIIEVYKALFKTGSFIKWHDVIDLLDANRDLVNINLHISRNEGFTKSLNEDKKIK